MSPDAQQVNVSERESIYRAIAYVQETETTEYKKAVILEKWEMCFCPRAAERSFFSL